MTIFVILAALQIEAMSKNIVGRALEREKLEATLKSHRSELIAIYGRRRIGKTYLIREFYSNYFTFSISGLRGGIRSDQIENFMIERTEAVF